MNQRLNWTLHTNLFRFKVLQTKADKLNMKRILLIALLMCSCKGSDSGGGAAVGACASSNLIGRWQLNSPVDLLTFNADCTGTGAHCDREFTFTDSGTSMTWEFTSIDPDVSCGGLGTQINPYDIGTDGSGVYIDVNYNGLGSIVRYRQIN